MAELIWWRKPRLRTDEPGTSPRKVTWLELFYDLVFVIVIAQLSHELAGHVTPLGLFHFVFLFIPISWMWLAGTYYNEYWETDDISIRVIVFAQMLAVVALALFVQGAFGESASKYALSYAAVRFLFAVMFGRAGRHDRQSRRIAWSYAVGFTVVAVMVAASAFTSSQVRLALWGAALVIEVVMPIIITVSVTRILPHRREISKLPERFGLFTIIVLGETVVGVFHGLSELQHLTLGIAFVGVLGLVTAVELWAIYFDFVARRPVKAGIWWEFVWGYLHLAFVMGVAAVGASLFHVIVSGDSALEPNVRWLLAGAVAVVLTTVSVMELTLQRAPEDKESAVRSVVAKLVVAAAVVALGLVGTAVGAAWLLAIIVGLLLIPTVLGARLWIREKKALPESERNSKPPSVTAAPGSA